MRLSPNSRGETRPRRRPASALAALFAGLGLAGAAPGDTPPDEPEPAAPPALETPAVDAPAVAGVPPAPFQVLETITVVSGENRLSTTYVLHGTVRAVEGGFEVALLAFGVGDGDPDSLEEPIAGFLPIPDLSATPAGGRTLPPRDPAPEPEADPVPTVVCPQVPDPAFLCSDGTLGQLLGLVSALSGLRLAADLAPERLAAPFAFEMPAGLPPDEALALFAESAGLVWEVDGNMLRVREAEEEPAAEPEEEALAPMPEGAELAMEPEPDSEEEEDERLLPVPSPGFDDLDGAVLAQWLAPLAAVLAVASEVPAETLRDARVVQMDLPIAQWEAVWHDGRVAVEGSALVEHRLPPTGLPTAPLLLFPFDGPASFDGEMGEGAFGLPFNATWRQEGVLDAPWPGRLEVTRTWQLVILAPE